MSNESKLGADGLEVVAAAKALCKHHAELCGVNSDDQWAHYSEDFLSDARVVIAALSPAGGGVILPERKKRPAGWAFSPMVDDGWNACLDEFARLNPPHPGVQQLGQCADFPNCPNLYCSTGFCTKPKANSQEAE